MNECTNAPQKKPYDILGIDYATKAAHARTVIGLWEVIPLPKPPLLKLNCIFQMEVYKPQESFWLSLEKRRINKELIADLMLYHQQWRLINVLQQIGDKKNE